MNHVLLVDDDVNFRRSLTIQLEFEGFNIVGCDSCKEAFSILERSTPANYPDVIITDIRMPNMTGDRFVLQLQDNYPSIPIIVISAFDPPDCVNRFPFIRKPFKIYEMVQAINHVRESETLG